MKGIDHLVLCVRDLDEARKRYSDMGFTLTPTAHHPFGTSNSLVQLYDKCFLELLAIGDRAKIAPADPGHFSFGDFNRNYIENGPGEGLSMLVLDSTDASSDRQAYEKAGLDIYEPFGFSRRARLPDGDEVTVGFSLTFVTHQEIPSAAFFTCQQHAPEHFWKPEYQVHGNQATGIDDVILLADDPHRYADFLKGFTGVRELKSWKGGVAAETARGDVSIISLDEWDLHYPASFAPDLAAGPCLAAYRVRVGQIEPVQERLRQAEITRIHYGRGIAVPPDEAFGVTIEFVTT
ncbi:MAG: VOC family protein [Pseudomonadota bacterium]